MRITFDGKSGAGFVDEGVARMHVRTMIDRARSEFGMSDVVGDEKLTFPRGEDGKRVFVKGSLAFD